MVSESIEPLFTNILLVLTDNVFKEKGKTTKTQRAQRVYLFLFFVDLCVFVVFFSSPFQIA
jgi:hypothetical protein